MTADPPLVLIRPTRADDLAAVAALHAEHLPHGLFPRLGPAFMQRWHGTFLDSPHGVSIVTVDAEGAVVGFLVGATDQRLHVSTVLRRHRGRLMAGGAWALLVRPRVAAHFLRTRALRYALRLVLPARLRAGRARDRAAPTGPCPAVLTAVAVSPAARGAGAGRALVRHFVGGASAAGASRAELVTKAGSAGAGAFYEGLGWMQVGERRSRDGDLVRRFVIDLAPRTQDVRDRGRVA